jgi:hypothetical protein
VEAAEHKEEPLTPLSVSPSNDSQTEGTGVLLRWLLRVSRRPTEGLATWPFQTSKRPDASDDAQQHKLQVPQGRVSL